MSESDSHERLRLTPEQRRFLGGAKSATPPPSHEQGPPEPEPEAKPKTPPPVAPRPPETPVVPEQQRAQRRKRGTGTSKAGEMQKFALVIGALILFAATFYIGKKFEYWRYLIAARNEAKIAARATGEFSGASAEELVEHAVMDEQVGHWEDAAKRLIAAKYKDTSLGGILFHAGKLYYDHSDFETADRLFDSAAGFNENVAEADYYRGMIAVSRSDFPAAERFFEAAMNAAPFKADYYYSLAETLRKDHKPKDAIARYQQAARRGQETEQTICRYKARLAALEAGDVDSVRNELEQQQKLGPLTIDWQMTAAAVAIQQGDTSQAVKILDEAREADRPQLDSRFAACVGDRFFAVAAQNNPELAQACRVNP